MKYLFSAALGLLGLAATSEGFLQPNTRLRAPLQGRTVRHSQLTMSAYPKARVAILGASGYTGAELTRILLQHPYASITVMTADKSAGQPFSDVYPQYAYIKHLPTLVKLEDIGPNGWANIDVVFCCLPHATTQEIIKGLPKTVKVVDLSADFRLADIEVYKKWYGGEHKAPELQKEAVYGLTEFARQDVKNARLVANPGCYPTAAQLPLIPLIEAGLISTQDIIIDAKSGTTGAGRSAKQNILYCEVTDGIHAYGVASHRHAPEIEQGLTRASPPGTNVIINFTPHLMPMSRGILESIYVKMAPGKTAADLKKHLQTTFVAEPFVHVLEGNKVPETRHVRASNNVLINVFEDRVPGRAIIISAIDNIVKGASGQAVQNFNVMFGFPETTGLTMPPVFP